MNGFLQLFLPAYFILFFLVLFVFRFAAVAASTGKNPVIFKPYGRRHMLVMTGLLMLLLSVVIFLILFTFYPYSIDRMLPVTFLNSLFLKWIGLALMLFSFIWIGVAQLQMKKSLRIGLDESSKTELVTTGLFSISRNPIYLGIITTLAGLFLAVPNIVTLALVLVAYFLFRLVIDIEEKFLTNLHGKDYVVYLSKVRMLI